MLGNVRALRAYYLHMRGKTDKAKKAYEAAFAAGCDSARYYSAYGVLLLRDSKFAQARDFYEGVIDRFEGNKALKPRKDKKGKLKDNPKYRKVDKANLSLNYAVSLWKTNDVDKAVDTLMRVYAKFRNASLYGSLGFMLIEQARATGDYVLAERINLEALDYESEDAVIQDNLGQLRFDQGDHQGAEPYLRKALQLKPHQVDSMVYLARALHAKGDVDQALEWIDKALSEEYKPLGTVSRSQAEELRILWMKDSQGEQK